MKEEIIQGSECQKSTVPFFKQEQMLEKVVMGCQTPGHGEPEPGSLASQVLVGGRSLREPHSGALHSDHGQAQKLGS